MNFVNLGNMEKVVKSVKSVKIVETELESGSILVPVCRIAECLLMRVLWFFDGVFGLETAKKNSSGSRVVAVGTKIAVSPYSFTGV